MKSLYTLTLILSTLYSISGNAQSVNDSTIIKNLDVFSAVYRKVLETYPDSVDSEHLMTAAINPMLETLDPFTRFHNRTETLEWSQRMTAKFGGIGVMLHDSPEGVMVLNTIPGAPAEKAGILPDDQITAINRVSIKELPFDEVFPLLKGEPGSHITLAIKRPSQTKEIFFTIERAIINISPVSYSGMLNNDIAYIRLTAETTNSAEEVKNALAAINTQHQFKGLVFDLRGNEGGKLKEAVKIANLFVNKGEWLTRIIEKKKDTIFYAMEDPVYPAIPIVVLIDNYTASSGEILAGAIQDNDRAVFIGQKTYGKGLVQSVFNMPGETQLILTTGNYYTPSGRCIQAYNYDTGTYSIADSLKTSFKTKNGRTVYNNGGISPDIETVPRRQSDLLTTLLNENIIFDFATDYKLRHASIPAANLFRIDEAEYNSFLQFAKARNLSYETATELQMKEVKEAAMKDGLWDVIKDNYELGVKNLARKKEQEFATYKTEISDALEAEIASRYYRNGKTQSELSKDPEVKKAIEILMDPVAYNKILNIK